jgi:hypothetical protein
VTLAEAQLIAGQQGLGFEEWKAGFADPLWPGTESLLIRRENGHCIYLQRLTNGQSICCIHCFKPASCLEWTSGLAKKECREGLLRDWGLTADNEREIRGPQEKFNVFLRYLDSLPGQDCVSK